MSTKLPKHLESLSKAQLESLCVDCGLCCYAKVDVAKGVSFLIPEISCRYLVSKGSGETCCSIYDERHKTAKSWCYPLAEAIEKGLFPRECPYVADMEGYVGALIASDDQYAQIKPRLQSVLSRKSKPDWVNPVQWAKFVNGEEYLKKSGFWHEDLCVEEPLDSE